MAQTAAPHGRRCSRYTHDSRRSRRYEGGGGGKGERRGEGRARGAKEKGEGGRGVRSINFGWLAHHSPPKTFSPIYVMQNITHSNPE